MDEQMKNLYDLLSGFYTLLWAQLDSLFDEHRWLRVPPDETQVARTPEVVLKELSALQQKGLPLPVSLAQMRSETESIKKLVVNWRDLQGQLKQKPKNKDLLDQKNELHRKIQDMRALFEDRALAFASLIAS